MFPALHSVYRLHALPLHRLLSNTQDNPLSFHPINKHPHASVFGCVRVFPFFLLKNRHAPKKQMTPRRTDGIISAKASDTKPQRRNCNETTFDCLCPCCFFDNSYSHRSVGKKGLKATWQRVLLLVGGTALVISALAALAWIAS